jgi:integrase
VPRATHRLSARSAATIAVPGYHRDGGGLYLQVTQAGARSWIFRYTHQGRAREMGLGPLRLVPLAEARALALACRRQLHEGVDPIEARRVKQAEACRAAGAMTFSEAADAYVAAHASGWRNAKHAKQWRSTLSTYAEPVFGSLPVAGVEIAHVMSALEPIWTGKTETASRLRGRIEAVLDWAAARGLRTGENPARWRGHLDHLLPARGRVARVVHHPALPHAEIPAFFAQLWAAPGTAALGLAFALLTASRTGEVIGARWKEIDQRAAIWIVPGERMKAGREHRVALSGPALLVLERAAQLRQSEWVFPGAREGRGLSNMAFLKLLERLGRGDITAHGFRSTFRDWVAECTDHPSQVAEMALAHSVSNKVEAAYRRGDLLERRRQLMVDWAAHCMSAVALPSLAEAPEDQLPRPALVAE